MSGFPIGVASRELEVTSHLTHSTRCCLVRGTGNAAGFIAVFEVEMLARYLKLYGLFGGNCSIS